MKKFAIVVLVITLLIAGFFAYAMLTRTMGIAVVNIAAEPASARQESFDMAREWAEDGMNSVVCFSNEEIGDSSAYSLVYVTVELTNWNPWAGEWIQLNVLPTTGDVLQVRQDPAVCRGLGKIQLQTLVYTRNPDPTTAREVSCEYYNLGRKYTITTAK